MKCFYANSFKWDHSFFATEKSTSHNLCSSFISVTYNCHKITWRCRTLQIVLIRHFLYYISLLHHTESLIKDYVIKHCFDYPPLGHIKSVCRDFGFVAFDRPVSSSEIAFSQEKIQKTTNACGWLQNRWFHNQTQPPLHTGARLCIV